MPRWETNEVNRGETKASGRNLHPSAHPWLFLASGSSAVGGVFAVVPMLHNPASTDALQSSRLADRTEGGEESRRRRLVYCTVVGSLSCCYGKLIGLSVSFCFSP